MLIAITGSSGSVGQAIVQYVVSAGHQVRCIDLAEPKNAVNGSKLQSSFVKANLTAWDETITALRGCDAVITAAAIPTPLHEPDYVVHNTNVNCSFNVLRACAELGIHRICQLSSINAIGSAYTPYLRKYHYLPLDEKHPYEPADSYGLSKQICEAQADYICRAFPELRVASIRPHMCLLGRPQQETAKSAEEEEADAKYGRQEQVFINDCWGWVLMEEVAKACLLGLTSEGWSGAEAFYIVAPTTHAYAQKVPLKQGWFDGVGKEWHGFFDTTKAETLLGWKHAV